MKFSIVVPVYNAAQHLRCCLDSIRAQTVSDWECICVDDGSEDESSKILEEYVATDSRFRVVRQKNMGVSAARNAGLDVARGEYVTWIDADDVMADQRLWVYKTIIAREHPDLVHLDFTMGNEPSLFLKEYTPDVSCDTYNDASAIFRLGWERMNFRGMVWLWCAKRTILDGMRFRVGMRIKEDGLFTLSLLPRLKKVCKGRDRGIFYRQTTVSAMHTLRRAQDCICYQEEFLKLWENQRNFAEQIGELGLLKWRIQRGSGTDVIDWILDHSKKDDEPEIARNVYRAYSRIRESGAFSGKFVQDRRYWPAFCLYERWGWQWPMRCCGSLFRFGGRIKRRICR